MAQVTIVKPVSTDYAHARRQEQIDYRAQWIDDRMEQLHQLIPTLDDGSAQKIAEAEWKIEEERLLARQSDVQIGVVNHENISGSKAHENHHQMYTPEWIATEERTAFEESERVKDNPLAVVLGVWRRELGGTPSRSVQSELRYWLTRMHINAVCYAIRETAYAPNPSWYYCRAILRRLVTSHLTGAEDNYDDQ